MKKTLITIACFAAMGAAHATYCPDNSPIGDHVNDDCHAPFKNPTKNPAASPSTATGTGVGLGFGAGFSESNALGVGGAGGNGGTGITGGVVGGTGGNGGQVGDIAVTPEQRQQQQQQAALRAEQNAQQRVSTDQRVVAGGAAVTIQGAQPGSGSTTTYTDKSRGAIFIPPVMFAPALPPMPGVNGGPVIGECGPRQAIWREPAYVLIRNNFGPDTRVQVGWDEYSKDVPAGEPRYIIEKIPTGLKEDGTLIETTIVSGHQVVIKKEALTRASGSGISIGGYGSNLGGQGGASGQAQVQDFVTSISLISCRLPIQPAVIVKPEYVDRPVIKYVPSKPRIIYRDRPVATPCCAPVVPVCCTARP